MTSKQLYNDNFNVSYVTRFMCLSFLLLIIVSYLYSFLGYKEEVPSYMEIIRMFGIFEYAVMIYLSLKNIEIKTLLKINVIIFLSLVILYKWVYAGSDIEVYGLAKDAYKYMKLGTKYGDLPFGEFISYILDGSIDVDDWGYFSVVYFFFKLYPANAFFISAIVVLNLVLLYYSSLCLYKLQMILTGNIKMSRLTTILWSASPFLLSTISDGMKEVIFTSIIIFAIYFIYKYKQSNNTMYIFLALGFSILCLFFRAAVFYITLLTIIVVLTMSEKNKKTYFVLIIIATFILMILLPILIDRFIGVSSDIIIGTTEYRINKAMKGHSSSAALLPYLSAFIGPFPILDRTGYYSIEHSPAIFIKNVIGLSFLIGSYFHIKRLDIKILPLLVYIFFSLMMLITAGVTLDMRYHMTYLPFFFIIAVPFIRKRTLLNMAYFTVMGIIIYLYGTRNL